MVACIHNYLDGRSSIQGQSQRGVSLTLQLSGLDLHTYWKSEQLKMKAIAFSELPPNFTPIGVSPTIWLRIWHAQSMVGVTFVGVRFGECPLQGSVSILDIQILNGWVPLRSFTLLTGIISETPKDPDSKLRITISFTPSLFPYHNSVSGFQCCTLNHPFLLQHRGPSNNHN